MNEEKTVAIATVSFPEIRLSPRDAHKVRGYFGEVFKEHSPLLHNHFQDGGFRYSYPLVQYKVIDHVPILVGLQDGSKLLTELFFQMKSLKINEHEFKVFERDIAFKNPQIGVTPSLHTYRFQTLWMALNQENFPEYMDKDEEGRRALLNRILTANILSFFKGIGLYLNPDERIMLTAQTQEKSTKFKDQKMMAFHGQFTTNVLLPDFIGLGKSVSRGFGTIQKIS
jgi:hypothetical protein